MDTFVVDGKGTRVHRVGRGHRVVYLHSEFGEVGALEFFSQLAGGGFEIVAPEIAGFGMSDPAPDWRRIEDVVFHLRRVLDMLEMPTAAVVGSSLGGWLAAELAVWFPDRVSSLVLVDAFGLTVEGAPVPDIFAVGTRELWEMAISGELALADALAPALAEADAGSRGAGAGSRGAGAGSGGDPGALRLHLFHAMEATARIGWNPYLHDPRLAHRLAEMRVPTLVVWGADDGIVPRAHGEKYASTIPGAQMTVIDDCGHLPALEMPRELSSAVASFLAEPVDRQR